MAVLFGIRQSSINIPKQGLQAGHHALVLIRS
jgi:hypothetical protein